MYGIEASMDAIDLNVEFEGERTVSEDVIPVIPIELCEDDEFRQAVLKVCERHATIFSRQV